MRSERGTPKICVPLERIVWLPETVSLQNNNIINSESYKYKSPHRKRVVMKLSQVES